MKVHRNTNRTMTLNVYIEVLLFVIYIGMFLFVVYIEVLLFVVYIGMFLLFILKW